MKKLLIISLALISLTLGQWSSLEHVFHKHAPGEQCDICLSAKSLDHGLITLPALVVNNNTQAERNNVVLYQVTANSLRHYSARAPPVFI